MPRFSRVFAGLFFTFILCLPSKVFSISLIDLEQKLAPNTDGNLESESEVFFNWGDFRTGFVLW